MNNGHHISAVIFDLDGTLLNTELVTQEILEEFLARYGKVVDLEKEKKRFGMIHHESAIATVLDYDLPITPQQYSESIMPMYYEKWLQAKPHIGVNRLIKHLHKHGVPLAIASNSRTKNVDFKLSSQKGWKEYFSVILGGDQVKSGKPSPDLFLEAANKLDVDPSCCLVLEDSVLGIQAGKAASMQVVVVPSIQSDTDEFSIADYVIHSFLDFQPELWGLPPFDDRVMKALPIEPVRLKGTYKNGLLQENSDNGESDLPGQVWGVFFGWVDFDSQKNVKIVVSISWDSLIAKHGLISAIFLLPAGQLQACFINGSDDQIFDQPMEVALVGYIRGFCTKKNPSTDSQILDQDKSIAEACLNLAAYSYHQV